MITMPCISLVEMNPNNVLVIDTETTGLDPETDELLQIAIVEYDGDGRFLSFFRPDRHTEWPAAMAVNHITPAAVALCHPAEACRDTIQKALDSADALVGYNVDLDLAFLDRIGVEFKVDDPEIKGHYLFAQFFRKPMSRSRMCRVDEIVSLTIEEEEK